MPDVTHFVRSFGDGWEAWYAGLQPKWRVLANDSSTTVTLSQDPPDDAVLSDWSEIKKGSQNGFFLLILTLGWWGVGASDQGPDELERWAAALDELRWVLEFLLNDEGDGGDDDEGDDEEGDDEEGDDDETVDTVPAKRASTNHDALPASKR